MLGRRTRRWSWTRGSTPAQAPGDPRRPPGARLAAGRDRRQHPRPLRPLLRQPRSSGRAVIWGHERCAAMIERTGEAQLAHSARGGPGPRRRAGRGRRSTRPTARSPTAPTIDLDGRAIELALPRPRPHGQRHRGHDPRRRRRCAPATCSRTARRPTSATATRWTGRRRSRACSRWSATATVVVPGHGDHAGRAFVEQSLAEIRAIADLARRVAARRAGRSRRRSPRRPTRRRRRASRWSGRWPSCAASSATAEGEPAARRLAADPHDPAAAGLAGDDRVEGGLQRRRGRPP